MFHRTLVEASRNKIFVKLYTIATEPFATQRMNIERLHRIHESGHLQDVGHLQIYRALKSRDAQKVRNLVEKHIQTVLDEPGFLTEP